jgi:hypothetical protein
VLTKGGTAMSTNLFEQISVNMQTGAICYPQLPGFELDMERVYRSAARFAQFCPSTEMAVRHAVHEQLSAHYGAMTLTRTL